MIMFQSNKSNFRTNFSSEDIIRSEPFANDSDSYLNGFLLRISSTLTL